MQVVFDHIPKTGGQSFATVIRTVYGNENVKNVRAGEDIGRALFQNTKYKAVIGHFFLKPDIGFADQRQYITIFRHPIDRIVSIFNFYSSGDLGVEDAATIKVKTLTSFDEFIENDDPLIGPMISNFYTRHYAAYLSNKIADITAAKAALDHFDMVGLLEQFSKTVDLFCYKTATTFDGDLPHVNVSSARHHISPEALAKVEKMNEADLELWVHAKNRFEKDYRAMMRSLLAMKANAVASGTEINDFQAPPLPAEIIAPRSFGSEEIMIMTGFVQSPDGERKVKSGEMAEVRLLLCSKINAENVTVGFTLYEAETLTMAFGSNSLLLDQKISCKAGCFYEVRFLLKLNLGQGFYRLDAAVHTGSDHRTNCYHWREGLDTLQVSGYVGSYSEGIAKLEPTVSIADTLLQEYSYGLKVEPLPDFKAQEANNRVTVTVRNTGTKPIIAGSMAPICLSYHWLKADGTLFEREGLRTPLPRTLKPGKSIKIIMNVHSPSARGKYILRLCMMQEFVRWLDQPEFGAVDIPVEAAPAD